MELADFDRFCGSPFWVSGIHHQSFGVERLHSCVRPVVIRQPCRRFFTNTDTYNIIYPPCFIIFRFSFFFPPLQDWNLSWNTTDPDVTLCFEKTVLIWMPCLFIWLFAPLEVYYLVKSKYRDIPWNWLNLAKMVCHVFFSINDIKKYYYII